MESVIRKFGNSKGAIIPAALLKELSLDVDDKLEIKLEDGRLVIEPVSKKKYSLKALLAASEGVDMSLNEEDKIWLNVPDVGKEQI